MGYDEVWRHHTWYDKLVKDEGVLPAQDAINTAKKKIDNLLQISPESVAVLSGAGLPYLRKR